ncbi:MAG: hypothetical protein Q7R81_06470 [Candidatus Peregrinibacteria bacterium]|nr:hypothetical protein [Candidatus Peregrinibacteria bacterium]
MTYFNAPHGQPQFQPGMNPNMQQYPPSMDWMNGMCAMPQMPQWPGMRQQLQQNPNMAPQAMNYFLQQAQQGYQQFNQQHAFGQMQQQPFMQQALQSPYGQSLSSFPNYWNSARQSNTFIPPQYQYPATGYPQLQYLPPGNRPFLFSQSPSQYMQPSPLGTGQFGIVRGGPPMGQNPGGQAELYPTAGPRPQLHPLTGVMPYGASPVQYPSPYAFPSRGFPPPSPYAASYPQSPFYNSPVYPVISPFGGPRGYSVLPLASTPHLREAQNSYGVYPWAGVHNYAPLPEGKDKEELNLAGSLDVFQGCAHLDNGRQMPVHELVDILAERESPMSREFIDKLSMAIDAQLRDMGYANFSRKTALTRYYTEQKNRLTKLRRIKAKENAGQSVPLWVEQLKRDEQMAKTRDTMFMTRTTPLGELQKEFDRRRAARIMERPSNTPEGERALSQLQALYGEVQDYKKSGKSDHGDTIDMLENQMFRVIDKATARNNRFATNPTLTEWELVESEKTLRRYWNGLLAMDKDDGEKDDRDDGEEDRREAPPRADVSPSVASTPPDRIQVRESWESGQVRSLLTTLQADINTRIDLLSPTSRTQAEYIRNNVSNWLQRFSPNRPPVTLARAVMERDFWNTIVRTHEKYDMRSRQVDIDSLNRSRSQVRNYNPPQRREVSPARPSPGGEFKVPPPDRSGGDRPADRSGDRPTDGSRDRSAAERTEELSRLRRDLATKKIGAENAARDMKEAEDLLRDSRAAPASMTSIHDRIPQLEERVRKIQQINSDNQKAMAALEKKIRQLESR